MFLVLGAAPSDLLQLAPFDRARVGATVQHLADAAGCPSSSPWRVDTLGVERVRDRDDTGALGVHLEDATRDRGLGVEDGATNVARAVADVPVPIQLSTRDRAGFCAPTEGIVGPRPG